MSQKYDKFETVINEQNAGQPRAIYGRYQGDPDDPVGQPGLHIRKLWPHVLGKTPDSQNGDEVALCYQYGGYSQVELTENPPKFRDLRCIKLNLLTILSLEVFAEAWDPIEFTFDMARRQNCVREITFYR